MNHLIIRNQNNAIIEEHLLKDDKIATNLVNNVLIPACAKFRTTLEWYKVPDDEQTMQWYRELMEEKGIAKGTFPTRITNENKQGDQQ